MDGRTIGQLRKKYASLIAPGDFFILLARATGRSKEFLLARPEHPLSADEYRKATDFLDRRKRKEPVAYILGEKEFFGLSFLVTRDTLIPRPETELLVEQAIGQLTVNKKKEPVQSKKILIADIGTGSGAIIVSLATELKNPQSAIRNPQFSFHATDISDTALMIAKENAERNGVGDRISFHHGNLLAPLLPLIDAADEIVVIANLPYLSEEIYRSAEDDVRRYEPRHALQSGNDGLDHYREFFSQIGGIMSARPDRRISGILEISPEQKEPVTGIFDGLFPGNRSRTTPDLSGRSRVFSFSLGMER